MTYLHDVCANCQPGPAGIRADHTKCMGGDCRCGCQSVHTTHSGVTYIEVYDSGGSTYLCPTCKRPFHRLWMATRHIEKHHQEES